MFLVGDRLSDEEMFIHVAMHEMLHVIGMDHSKTAESVMYFATNDQQHVVCMDRTDAESFCALVGCQAERLNYCVR